MNTIKPALVIGAYEHFSAVELGVACCRKLNGDDVPILISDDHSSNAQERLSAIASKYPNVEWRTNDKRWGLDGRDLSGDQHHFWSGLIWARDRGCDTLMKFSQRFIPFGDNLKDYLYVESESLMSSRKPVSINRCFEGKARFHCRSEAVLMVVSSFTQPDVLADMAPTPGNGGEPQVWAVICKHFNGLPKRLSFVGVQRQEKCPGVLFHTANGPEDYQRVAAVFGIEFESSPLGPSWRTVGKRHVPVQMEAVT